jgi:hypothetical protein
MSLAAIFSSGQFLFFENNPPHQKTDIHTPKMTRKERKMTRKERNLLLEEALDGIADKDSENPVEINKLSFKGLSKLGSIDLDGRAAPSLPRSSILQRSTFAA